MLTGEDLLELGITTFGARKRLLMAINQLKTENPTTNEWHSISECKDIPSLLTQLNLERYIRMHHLILITITTNPTDLKSIKFNKSLSISRKLFDA